MNDGEPAYPVVLQYFEDFPARPAKGMSLRDYFAGQALIGLLGMHGINPNDPNRSTEPVYVSRHLEAVRHAYSLADAMLRERERGSDEATE